MGTNYYVTPNRPSIHGTYHIGKASAGWRFLFQDQDETWNDPPVVWHTWPQVKEWLQKYTVESNQYVIMNEYDEIVSFDDFVDLVESKQHDPFCRDNPYANDIDGYRFENREFW